MMEEIDYQSGSDIWKPIFAMADPDDENSDALKKRIAARASITFVFLVAVKEAVTAALPMAAKLALHQRNVDPRTSAFMHMSYVELYDASQWRAALASPLEHLVHSSLLTAPADAAIILPGRNVGSGALHPLYDMPGPTQGHRLAALRSLRRLWQVHLQPARRATKRAPLPHLPKGR